MDEPILVFEPVLDPAVLNQVPTRSVRVSDTDFINLFLYWFLKHPYIRCVRKGGCIVFSKARTGRNTMTKENRKSRMSLSDLLRAE